MNDPEPRGFLRAHWMWIVLPALGALLGLAALLWFTGGDNSSAFSYDP